MKKILFNLLLLSPTICANAQSILGTWNGKITFGPQSLPLVLHLSQENGHHKCLLDSPDQGAKGIPATIDFLSTDSLAIRVPAIGASFTGKMKEGLLKGSFCQSGLRIDLQLKPGDFFRERKQTPKMPLAYATEEVTFENPKDHAVLSGTISYPTTYTPSKETPVVLFVTGSGPQNRDEEIMGHKPFAVIADYLAQNGIASLRYDDRGYGKSTGDTNHATSYTLMTDALAGIRYLKSTGKFGKIGIIGHSEGGLIAFMSAATSPKEVDFIISLAGTAVRGSEILVRQNEVLLSSNPATRSFSEDYVKVLTKVLSHISQGQSVENALETVNQYCKDAGANLPEVALQNLQGVLTSCSPWMKYFVSYDPTEVISETTCPVMAVNGEKDTQVDADINLAALRRHLPANTSHLLKSYPNLNHLFQHCTTGLVNEYGSIEETFSPEVLEDIARWIEGLK